MDESELARLLSSIDPKGRDVLRRAMRADQWERDALAVRLQRENSEGAQEIVDLVDLASLSPELRQQLNRVLAELEAHA